LLPVYDRLEDGAELMWWDKGLMTSAQIQKLVRGKENLPVFDDQDVDYSAYIARFKGVGVDSRKHS